MAALVNENPGAVAACVAKARALLDGRHTPLREDVDALAVPVLRHRIVTNFNAEAEGINTDKIIDRLLEYVGSQKAVAKA